MNSSTVSIVRTAKAEYPSVGTLFRPSVFYPEYPFDEIAETENLVYDAVREGLFLQGYDVENYGKKTWNPLGKVIKPGDRVLIKPNLVMDKNPLNGDTECLYTQPSVVACIVDYVIIALGRSGEIVIGDAPMQECDFQNLLKTSGYEQLIKYYRDKGYNISAVDFRELTSKVVDGVHMSMVSDDAEGKVINLGEDSEFYGISPEKLNEMRITNYDPKILPLHHNGETHEYYISDYVLKSDVIINMPKPKSHRKAGATISLKNFVGVNIRKEYLPHHTKGSVVEGGDEYDKKSVIHALRSKLYDKKNWYEAKKEYRKAKLLKYVIRVCSVGLKLQKNKYAEGSWYGNNTISKTVSDINKIVYYANKEGILQESMQRKVIIVADMIKAGEGEGPVLPTTKECGIIAIGSNPVCFDEVISGIMGFDFEKIPTIVNARSVRGKYPIVEQQLIGLTRSNVVELDGKKVEDIKKGFHFRFCPTSGWKGHIEIN